MAPTAEASYYREFSQLTFIEMSDLPQNPGHNEMSPSGRWAREQQDKGLCARCWRRKFGDHSLCKGHLVRSRMSQWANNRPECKPYRPSGGRGPGADPLFILAEQLLQKLEQQNFKCAVTAEPIDLAINAQIDHIVGILERPDLAFELSNLRWVSRKVNQGILKRTGPQSNKESKLPSFRIAIALKRVLYRTANYEFGDSVLAQKWLHLKEEIEAFTRELDSH